MIFDTNIPCYNCVLCIKYSMLCKIFDDIVRYLCVSMYKRETQKRVKGEIETVFETQLNQANC